ncbi:MAG: AAA family ATPase [Opitutales bacterium]|nr:AAA family ATPase [Opitutales bacterium]
MKQESGSPNRFLMQYKDVIFNRYLKAIDFMVKELLDGGPVSSSDEIYDIFGSLDLYKDGQIIRFDLTHEVMTEFVSDFVEKIPARPKSIRKAQVSMNALLVALSETAPNAVLERLPALETMFRAGVAKRSELVSARKQAVARLHSKRRLCLTKSQLRVYEELKSHLELYFSRDEGSPSWMPGCELNLNMLLVSPTGSGKSGLIDELAGDTGCHLMRITRQCMVPVGASDAIPTLQRIARRLQTEDRIMLHLDELDKYFTGVDSGWERSNLDLLYSMLERKIDWTAIKFDAGDLKQKWTVDQFNEAFRNKVFIIGSGTWQILHTSRDPGSRVVGFSSTSETEDEGLVLMRRLKTEGGLPEEVARRFSLNVLRMDYPDLEDTDQMLKDLKIYDLAEKVGRVIKPEDIHYEGHGIAIITHMATELTIEYKRQCGASRRGSKLLERSESQAC